MTTIAETRLSADLQALVDARLDTIDRMLLVRVDRQDRLAIVREVEGQIFELLSGRDGSSLDRDEVLAVLARLDPPEAYLPEGGATAPASPPRASSIPRAVPAVGSPRTSPLSLAGGILGIASLSFALLCCLLKGMPNAGQFIFLCAAGLGFVACILAIKSRLRGAWAIIGLVTGTVTLLTVLAAWLSILMQQ